MITIYLMSGANATVHLMKSSSNSFTTHNHHGDNLVVRISSMSVNLEQVDWVSNKRKDYGQKHFLIEISKILYQMAVNCMQ